MKRQHRSTLDRCRIYLNNRLREMFGYTRIPDWHYEYACDSVACRFSGDLTFDNWRIAVDKAYPF